MDVQDYYDDFANLYDNPRGVGYHALIDELEAGIVLDNVGERARILEVGCGTGLIMHRIGGGGRRVVGVDLSRSMLRAARGRDQEVAQADALALPFESESFDAACSFKVLAHIPRIGDAIAEMARVVRVGGTLVTEFYNARSLRYLAKRIAGPRQTGLIVDESDVPTRWDLPTQLEAYFPSGVRIKAMRGVRVFTPYAGALELPLVGRSLRFLERVAAKTSMVARVGGFVVVIGQKVADT